MIYKDAYGLPVSSSGDGMDSAVRAGLLAIFGELSVDSLLSYSNDSGECVRHPYQSPANNHKNFTKDQLKCYIAGLYSLGQHDRIEKILQAHERRLYFCDNSERDYVGSKKYPWPHHAQDWYFPDGGTPKPKGSPELRLFDFADPLLPNDILFLELAAKRSKFTCGTLGKWFHEKALTQHIKGSYIEQNQMFSECYVLGTLEKFKETSSLKAKSAAYWVDRGEIEYHKMMMEFLEYEKA